MMKLQDLKNEMADIYYDGMIYDDLRDWQKNKINDLLIFRYARLQIEKDRESLISNWGGITRNEAEYIRKSPINLD